MRARILRIGVHYEPSNVDPHIGSAELALQMTNAVFDTLVNRTAAGDYLPGLAEHFDLSSDQCVYTFRLRQGVRFHDGTPCDAAAVAFSLERAHDPANKSQLAGGMLGPYRGCRILDDLTLLVELDSPYALLLDALSQGWLAPVSPTAVGALGTAFSRHPVGTGPFVFDQWIPGDRIILKRNGDYRLTLPADEAGPAALDQIHFHFLGDDTERTAALTAGTVDAVFFLPPADAPGIRADDRFAVMAHPIRGLPVCLMMNTARPPTDDIRVRRAVNLAIDQAALVDAVFGGEFPPAHGPVSQFTLGYSATVENRYPCAPDAAGQMLDEAGWRDIGADGVRRKDGERLRLQFYALPVNSYPEIGQIVSQQLGRVGIDVEVVLLMPLEWIRAGMNGDHHLIPQGKYGSSAQLMSFVYHSRHSGPDGYGWSKRTAAHRPGLDALLERGEQASSPHEYLPLFRQAQEIVMDEALIAPLHCNTNIVAAHVDVRGIEYDATGAYPLFHGARV